MLVCVSRIIQSWSFKIGDQTIRSRYDLKKKSTLNKNTNASPQINNKNQKTNTHNKETKHTQKNPNKQKTNPPKTKTNKINNNNDIKKI